MVLAGLAVRGGVSTPTPCTLLDAAGVGQLVSRLGHQIENALELLCLCADASRIPRMAEPG